MEFYCIARVVYPILVTSIVKIRQTRVFTKSGHHLFVTIKRTLAEVSVLAQILWLTLKKILVWSHFKVKTEAPVTSMVRTSSNLNDHLLPDRKIDLARF